jgi:hypothetical protein
MPAKLKIARAQTAASPGGQVDSGFNNPDGSGSTYGVVGGRTSLTGDQISARVAVAKNAMGTIYTDVTSNVAYGMVTPLTDLSTGSALSTSDNQAIGFVGAVNSGILLAITNTVATGNFVKTSGNVNTSGGVGTPVWFDTSFGPLTVNTPYFIKYIANATHFTVSATSGGGNITMTTINGITANLNQQSANLTANALVGVSNSQFIYADNKAGYVLRQKGKRKYLVADATDVQDENIKAGSTYIIKDVSATDWSQFGAGPDAANGKIFTSTVNGSAVTVNNGVVHLVGVCKTANLANAALTTNTMNLQATKTPSGTVYLDSLTSHHAIDFTDNGIDENAGTHYYASFNGAVAVDASAGRPYMVVDVRSA